MSLINKTTFDSYKINGILKSGGMATIYDAFDSKNRERIALKIIHDSLSSQSDLASKFLREGDILEKLQNDELYNTSYPIVRVKRHSRENNDPDGTAFIALEFLKGIDLQDFLLQLHLKSHKLNLIEATQIILQVAKALTVCHRRNIWHRDLSPDNIFLLQEGAEKGEYRIKLIDFGVAKFEFLGTDSLGGALFGKPPYMSPEQCQSKPVDGRSDIYSLGMIFFTLLTGTPPFIADNPIEVLKMHVEMPLPPIPNSVPIELQNIVKKMCEKDVSSRYQKIEELVTDLEKMILNLPVEQLTDSSFSIIKEKSKITKKDDRKSFTFHRLKKISKPKKEPEASKSKIVFKINLPSKIAAIVLILIVVSLILIQLFRVNNVTIGKLEVFPSQIIQYKSLGITEKEYLFKAKLSSLPINGSSEEIDFLFQKRGDTFYKLKISNGSIFLLKLTNNNEELVAVANKKINNPGELLIHSIHGRIYIYYNREGLFSQPIQNTLSISKSEISVLSLLTNSTTINWEIENL